jgi:hypothetical protein
MLVGMHFAQQSDVTYKLQPETLPARGWIAEFEGAPVAAGFLRLVEGGYAQIDTLVTNPDMPGELRHEAINSIVRNLITDAKSLNLKGIVCYSRDADTLGRSKSFGFQLLDAYSVISLAL